MNLNTSHLIFNIKLLCIFIVEFGWVPSACKQILVPVFNSQTGFVISPTRHNGWVVAFNFAGGLILVFW